MWGMGERKERRATGTRLRLEIGRAAARGANWRSAPLARARGGAGRQAASGGTWDGGRAFRRAHSSPVSMPSSAARRALASTVRGARPWS